MAPTPPHVRRAPAEPWPALIYGGAPTWPPHPCPFGPPRRSRGAPLWRASMALLLWGAPVAPWRDLSLPPPVAGFASALLDELHAGDGDALLERLHHVVDGE